MVTPPSSNGSSFLRKAGHLYKKTGLSRSWRPRFFSLEGTVLYYYKREGDSVPKGIVVLTGCHVRATTDKKLYSFRISHPKTSKVYDLAATLPSRTEDWIQALTQASTMAQTSASPASSRPLTSHTSSSDVLHSSHSMDPSITELVDVPNATIPDMFCDRMESLLTEFVALATDADGWKLQTEHRDVKAYVRRASKTGTFKGVGFIAQHPHKVLQLVLELSRRQTFDPQLLATQRVHVFNDHTWVDHLTYKAVFPAAARDFVNLTHWRVLKDGSIVVVATYANDDSFIKNQEPHIVRGKIIMAGFLITPNKNYTGVDATYITRVDVKTGIPAGLQAKMFIKQAFVVDGLRKTLDEDESPQQWEHVTNNTVFGISTTDCVEDEEEAYSMRPQSVDVQEHDDQGETQSNNRPCVVPQEGFPAVPEEYSEIIEKAVARMEAEMNDESSWNFIGDKDGVKAYTRVDGSLTAAKGVGYLPYHPRAIWEQVIDAARRKLVDPQLALGMNLKTLNAHTNIDYFEYKSMFVVAGRDFCTLTHWRVLPSGAIIVVAQSIEVQELCPLKEPKIVRGDLHLGCTKIVPNAAYDGAEVTTMVKTDLKGSIPGRIAGKAAADQPFVIFRMGEVIKMRRDLIQGTDESIQVMDISKTAKSTVSDIAMYAIQFGGAVLALKTAGLPTTVHFVTVVLILFFALKLHLGPNSMSHRRKMRISSFGTPDSGIILSTLKLDMTKTNEYITERRKNSVCHLTIMHIVLRALGEALSKAPSVNGHIAFGNYYPAPTVDVSCLVAVASGNDLSVCRLPNIDKMTLQDVVNRVRGGATKIRGSNDKTQENRNKIIPTWAIHLMVNVFGWLGSACGLRIPLVGVEPYMFGSCMVTSVGMMGLDMTFLPITPYSQVPMLMTIGSIKDEAVVVNGKVAVRPMLTVTTTIDDLYIDSSEAASMTKTLKAIVEDPSLLEAVPSALGTRTQGSR
ncbi:2-oxo acid dehydrogenase acyltransferase catalytic domain protein [Phytophthora megakarya]|uniref:2-oxo acid dehydrogenase acyltransferase catalytic domain protein n=1 Tax=Phytophthora megakarya TaxID=4795 RepID=A0A225W1F2_9STRA|nr:2-oxo acid dehydrogenase acyltransferase catalytic domain protein [Phytophthora megakarya]